MIDVPDSRSPDRKRIWACEASIWSKHSDPTSLALAISEQFTSGSIATEMHYPDSPTLKQSGDIMGYRCVGVIEATDREMEALAHAGYRLADLRKAAADELLRAINASVH